MSTLFFDLFWTLIKPSFDNNLAENQFVNLSEEEWNKYVFAEKIETPRYLGQVKDEDKIIIDIIKTLPFIVDDQLIPLIKQTRLLRIRDALVNVKPEIIQTLDALKDQGHNLCLISNADTIDIHYWNESPLRKYFDEVVFSCNEGVMKPDEAIYRLALTKMKANPYDSVYIGDGGSNELFGAHCANMRTVFTEHFILKSNDLRQTIMQDADYTISDFKELIKICKNPYAKLQ